MNFALDILGLPSYTYYEFELFGFFLMILALLFILIIGWFVRKGPFLINLKRKTQLNNYIFNFQNKEVINANLEIEDVSFGTKLILYVLSFLIISLPFSVFVNDHYSNWVWYVVW